MDPRLVAAIIAGTVSILVAIIGYFIARAKMRAEFDAIQLQHKHIFIVRLLELRLEAYPDVFEITQNIGKSGKYTDDEIMDITQNALQHLVQWQSTKSYLLLSEKSLESYYELKDRLSKNPAHSNGYSPEQLAGLWAARNNFRGSLRSDIGVLHSENPV